MKSTTLFFHFLYVFERGSNAKNLAKEVGIAATTIRHYPSARLTASAKKIKTAKKHYI